MLIRDIINNFEKEVDILGWVIGKRSSGKIHFIQIRDGSAFCQVVVSKDDVDEKIFQLCDHLTLETSVKIKGKVKKENRAKLGAEIHLIDIEIISKTKEEYPIPRKPSGPDFLMKFRHLWLRSPKQAAIMRIRSTIVTASRKFFDDRGFYCIDAPIFTPSACEGTTTLFKVDYFENNAFLSQSGQLYNEATALSLGKVYCFGPSFRAEKSKTRRHLTEFWQIEPELIFVELKDIIELSEDLIDYIVKTVINKNKLDLKIIERDISILEKIKKPFPRLSYTEAVEILKKKDINIEWGEDFGAPEETLISKEFSSPVCIYNYPTKIKAFYMKTNPKNQDEVLGLDILAPEGYGEIVGGGIREEDLNSLQSRLKEHNLSEEDFKWYLDLRRFGSVPHGGFGLGIERTVAWICGIKHIREAVSFPRTIDRIKP